MTTKLEGPLRREVDIDGAAYTLTITPQGLALVPKGRRKGYELAWKRARQRRRRAGDGAERVVARAAGRCRRGDASEKMIAMSPERSLKPGSPAPWRAA